MPVPYVEAKPRAAPGTVLNVEGAFRPALFALGEQAVSEKSSIKVAAFAFYVISCVSISFFIVPLIWAIPATIYVKNRIDRREKISLLFKVFSFFFVSLIGGFILFFRDEALMRKPGEA